MSVEYSVPVSSSIVNIVWTLLFEVFLISVCLEAIGRQWFNSRDSVRLSSGETVTVPKQKRSRLYLREEGILAKSFIVFTFLIGIMGELSINGSTSPSRKTAQGIYNNGSYIALNFDNQTGYLKTKHGVTLGETTFQKLFRKDVSLKNSLKCYSYGQGEPGGGPNYLHEAFISYSIWNGSNTENLLYPDGRVGCGKPTFRVYHHGEESWREYLLCKNFTNPPIVSYKEYKIKDTTNKVSVQVFTPANEDECLSRPGMWFDPWHRLARIYNELHNQVVFVLEAQYEIRNIYYVGRSLFDLDEFFVLPIGFELRSEEKKDYFESIVNILTLASFENLPHMLDIFDTFANVFYSSHKNPYLEHKENFFLSGVSQEPSMWKTKDLESGIVEGELISTTNINIPLAFSSILAVLFAILALKFSSRRLSRRADLEARIDVRDSVQICSLWAIEKYNINESSFNMNTKLVYHRTEDSKSLSIELD